MTLGLQMINWMIKPGFWYDPEGVPLNLHTEVETCPPGNPPTIAQSRAVHAQQPQGGNPHTHHCECMYTM